MDRIKINGATEMMNEKWAGIIQIIQAAQKEDNHNIQTFIN